MKDNESNSKGFNFKSVFPIMVSLVLTLIMLFGVYFIVIFKPSEKDNETVVKNVISSDIVSTIPEETALRFIKANGTMGNMTTDITQDKMKTGEAISENSARRLLALHKVNEAIIPGSPLISSYEESNIKTFTRDLVSPYIYTIDNIKISEPDNLREIVIYAETGPIEYEALDVYASFDSTRINYTRARDTSYDGTHIQLNNTENFSNVKVVLAKSGDLWFIYDIEDSEYIINERFATWSGIGASSVDYSKNIESGTFKIEGIIPIDEGPDNYGLEDELDEPSE
ncbi:MAG TPA: hypothetical protein GXZ90_10635 [Clostridiales bacterium]|nr:hypothetical protein [Clostridiales bacterium]